MRQRALSLAVLSLASVLVAGCQSMNSGGRQFQAGARISPEADPAVSASRRLADGKAALDARNYATAAAAFRSAALDPALAAEAHNGLAVAYAGIGREDLADRYFRMAIAENPLNPRYQANLARLNTARQTAAAFALARLADDQRTPPERRFAGTALRPAFVLVSHQDRLVRLSASSVMVHTAQPRTMRAPAISSARQTARPALQRQHVAQARPRLIQKHVELPKAIVRDRKRAAASAAIATTAVLIPQGGPCTIDLASAPTEAASDRATITLAHGTLIRPTANAAGVEQSSLERLELPEPLFGFDETFARGKLLAFKAR